MKILNITDFKSESDKLLTFNKYFYIFITELKSDASVHQFYRLIFFIEVQAV